MTQSLCNILSSVIAQVYYQLKMLPSWPSLAHAFNGWRENHYKTVGFQDRYIHVCFPSGWRPPAAEKLFQRATGLTSLLSQSCSVNVALIMISNTVSSSLWVYFLKDLRAHTKCVRQSPFHIQTYFLNVGQISWDWGLQPPSPQI